MKKGDKWTDFGCKGEGVWRYALLRVPSDLSGYEFSVCEIYQAFEDFRDEDGELDIKLTDGIMHTGPVQVFGESPEDLVRVLEWMLKDVKDSIERGLYIDGDEEDVKKPEKVD